MNIRKLALETLSKCESAEQYSNLALDAKIKKFNIVGDDRALFTVLVYGTIEHKLTLDYYISVLSSLPDSKIDSQTRNILRLGLYQIIFMRTADHAAVNETVSLAPARSRGFVNALLRNFIRKRDQIKLPDKASDAAYSLSIEFSYPSTTVKKLIDCLGVDETENFLRALDTPPPLTLRTNTLKVGRDELSELLMASDIKVEKTRFSPYGIKLLESRAYSELDEKFKGMFFIQDEASQIATAALDARPNDIVMDICACPGSKSFGAAMTMENKGRILAYDLSKSKLPLILSGANRLGIDIISAEAHDGRKLISSLEGSADRIICDVPCSGFGVIAKKPDIRYKDISAIAKLPNIQYDIITTAAKYLKIGGIMAYSTCTIFAEENENIVSEFLKNNPNFELVPFKAGELECEKGFITLMPHIHGTDGFFVAKLRRIK